MSYKTEVFADNPVAYWRFTEIGGPTTADELGDNNGSVVGADLNVLGPGNLGSAVRLDGVDDRITVADTTDLHLFTFTLECWFRCTGSGAFQVLMNRQATTANRNWWMVVWDGDLVLRVRGDHINLVDNSKDYRDSQWYYVAATVDNVEKEAHLFVGDLNNAPTQTAFQAFTNNPIVDAADSHIGAETGSSRWFQGDIDEVAIYPSALSVARIQAHYDMAFEELSEPTVLATAIGRSDFPSSLTHDVELPVGITAGERLLMMFQSTNSISQVSGWDELGNIGNRFYIFHRIADGTEGPTVTVEMSGSTTHWASNVYRISGVGNGPEVEFGINGVNDPPEVIASWGSDDNLFIAAMSNQRTDQIVSAPTDYTNFITAASEDNSSVSSRIRVSSARRELVSALDDPGPFGVDGDIQDEKCATLVFGGLGVITDFDPANLQVTVDGTTGQLSWDASPLLAP